MTIIKHIKDIIERHPHIQLCLLFGSGAQGKLRPDSDLDIAVAAQHELSADEKLELMSDLSAHLRREVDLVDLNAVAGPILKQVLCDSQRIFVKNTALYALILKKMWYNQADMMPLYEMILRKRREFFIHG